VHILSRIPGLCYSAPYILIHSIMLIALYVPMSYYCAVAFCTSFRAFYRFVREHFVSITVHAPHVIRIVYCHIIISQDTVRLSLGYGIRTPPNVIYDRCPWCAARTLYLLYYNIIWYAGYIIYRYTYVPPPPPRVRLFKHTRAITI